MPSEHSEQNPHSRNLKVISVFFILYWLCGLSPSDESIRLAVKSYEISNPEVLRWASYSLLFYFAWRFHLSSGRRVFRGIKKETRVKSSTGHMDKGSRLYSRLVEDAEADYVANKKEEFEREREGKQAASRIVDFNNDDYEISVSNLSFMNSKKLMMEYNVKYKGDRLPGNDFRKGNVEYRWFNFIPLRILGVLRFSFSTEEGPDYLLPWLLFLLALVCAFFIHFGVDAAEVMDGFTWWGSEDHAET